MFRSENSGVIIKCSKKRDFFRWDVPNYFAFQSKYATEIQKLEPRIISSPLFSAFNNKWCLALIPNVQRNQTGYVGFFLWMMTPSNPKPNIEVGFRIRFHDKVQGMYNEDSYEDYYDHENRTKYNGDLDSDGHFGCWNFLNLEYLSNQKRRIAPHGVLTFWCAMKEKILITNLVPELTSKTEEEDDVNSENATSEDAEEKEIPDTKGVDRLLQNFKRILLEEDDYDAILKVQDREFKVHRTILKARSPVFASMFKHDTKENTTGAVDIPDCSAAAFEIFLSYLYTASADNMSSDNVFDLYYAADKYQINDLKSECVEYIENNLTVQNFCTVMTLSLQHSELGLQEKAKDFFCENVKLIVKTVQWQKYLREHPTEANELYIKAIDA